MSPDLQRKADIATAQGLTLVPADDRTLLLDIDSEADLRVTRAMLSVARTSVLDCSGVTYTRSKSGHWHIYVHLNAPLPPLERYTLQASLGSDKLRELGHLREYRETGVDQCVFFEPQGVQHQPFP